MIVRNSRRQLIITTDRGHGSPATAAKPADTDSIQRFREKTNGKFCPNSDDRVQWPTGIRSIHRSRQSCSSLRNWEANGTETYCEEAWEPSDQELVSSSTVHIVVSDRDEGEGSSDNGGELERERQTRGEHRSSAFFFFASDRSVIKEIRSPYSSVHFENFFCFFPPSSFVFFWTACLLFPPLFSFVRVSSYFREIGSLWRRSKSVAGRDGVVGYHESGARLPGHVPEQGGDEGQDLPCHSVRIQVRKQWWTRRRSTGWQEYKLGSQSLSSRKGQSKKCMSASSARVT